MNKNIITLVILFSLTIPFGCKKESVFKEGIVNIIMGSVTIKKDDKSYQAKVGDVIVADMTIETGAKSTAYIHFGKNVVALLENSILSIDKLSPNAEFHLANGEILSKIVKKSNKGDSLRVKTLTTVAAIRGTEFGVFEKNGQSTVACLSGNLDVANTSLEGEPEFVKISDNEETQIVAGKPVEVKPLSEENKKRMKNIFDNIDKKSSEYVAEMNDALWKISLKVYGDSTLWPLIYMGNKDQIKNPNLITPGQKFIIPPLNEDKNVNREAAKKIRIENFGAAR